MPLFISGGLNDPRVTYREPAKLRATKIGDNVLLLKTNMGAGHGGKSGRFESLREGAEGHAFVLWQSGVEEQAMNWVILAGFALANAPSPEAEALGVRLARTGTLATIAPMLTAKDTEEIVAEHPELSETERTALRTLAKRNADAMIARLNSAFGHAYAQRLTVAELKQLVTAAEQPAAGKLRRIMPETMVAAMGALGKIDFKQDTLAAFCRDTGKLCPKPK